MTALKARTSKSAPPKIGFVSLGCPKALVDSERIITKLRAEGYELSASYEGADAVVVNTCGFLNSAKEESLEAIGRLLGGVQIGPRAESGDAPSTEDGGAPQSNKKPKPGAEAAPGGSEEEPKAPPEEEEKDPDLKEILR